MKKDNKNPILIKGNSAVDKRGHLSFVNDFNFKGVKRFYIIENSSTKIIRAWHGHLKEGKYVFIAQGSVIVAAVKIDNTKTPNKKNKIYRFILSSKIPSILYIPPGFANGFRSIENNTKIIFFSTSTLTDSQKDDYRYPVDYWSINIWKK